MATMDRPRNGDWFFALLTAATFLAMLLTWVFAFLDALDGSRWCAAEFALGFICGVSFVSLLATHDPVCHMPTNESVVAE